MKLLKNCIQDNFILLLVNIMETCKALIKLKILVLKVLIKH